MRELRSVDEFVKDNPTAAVIPEKVASRMGKRLIPFVGIPLFGTMGVFIAFWYLAVYKGIQFETSLVAYSTIFALFIGLIGITYSVMSASWDPDEEGSKMGVDEFKSNVDNLRSGLKRSRENFVIREKMKGVTDEEINKSEVEKIEIKKLSFQEKMDKELGKE